MSLNTIVSRLFRATVVVHFACLSILLFGMRNTLGGSPYHRVAVGLTILIIMIAALFVTDMATRTDASRAFAKRIDAVVGCLWIAVEAMLVMNSLRAGELHVNWILGVVVTAILAASALLLTAKLFGKVRQAKAR